MELHYLEASLADRANKLWGLGCGKIGGTAEELLEGNGQIICEG